MDLDVDGPLQSLLSADAPNWLIVIGAAVIVFWPRVREVLPYLFLSAEQRSARVERLLLARTKREDSYLQAVVVELAQLRARYEKLVGESAALAQLNAIMQNSIDEIRQSSDECEKRYEELHAQYKEVHAQFEELSARVARSEK